MNSILDRIVGLKLERVTYDERTKIWDFHFGSENRLSVQTPWRIVKDGHIMLGSVDHQQKFGLPEKLDATNESTELLDAAIKNVMTNSCGDVFLECHNGATLEVFNSSSGYEGWSFFSHNQLAIVAQGGGNTVDFS